MLPDAQLEVSNWCGILIGAVHLDEQADFDFVRGERKFECNVCSRKFRLCLFPENPIQVKIRL